LSIRKKLGIAASLCAVTAMVVGIGAEAASAESIAVRPYLFGNIGVGTTIPGDPATELCLVTADDPPTYGGLINGAPGGGPGQLNVTITAQDFLTLLPTCVPTNIALDTDPLLTIGANSTSPNGGGSLQIATISNTPPGIQAVAFTKIRVNLSNNQSVKLPSGAFQSATPGGDLASSTCTVAVACPGGGVVQMTLKEASTTTKSLLDPFSCADEQYIVNRNLNDDNPKSGAPTATPIDSTDPLDPEVGDAGTYVATFRNCAQQDTTTAGKTVKTKILVTGDGASSVDFVQSSTTNPATWDTTRGKVCTAAKYQINTDVALKIADIDSSRVLICKGEYGEVIPFSIDVREWVDNTPGQLDTYGLLHPGAPEEILAFTFT
jgi:hypothetical protein